LIVYKITNLVNGKVYIGQTRQKLSIRFRQHSYNKSNCSALYKAINKYGPKSFTIEAIFETQCPVILNHKEQEFIKDLKAMGCNGYNLTSGGEGGYVRSDETKARLSSAGKGKSRAHTAESKAKLSESHKGSKNPMFGKKMSDEHKAKISLALKGRKRPQVVIDKIKANHNPISNLNLTHNRS
jgi:group I intron endonuclease